MALARSTLLAVSSASEFGTGVYTPAAFNSHDASLLIAIVAVSIVDGVADPSGDITISSSPELTWTRRVYIGNAASWACGIAIFTAPVATGASTTITLDCGTRDVATYRVHVFEEIGYNTSTPTGATATNGNFGTDGAASLTLSGAPASTSEIIAAKFNDMDAGVGTSTEGSGWVELADIGDAAWSYLESQARGSSTSTDVPWQDINDGAGSVVKSIAAALEIRAAAGGTAALTGTATASITEADIVAGGKTILITLTGDTWIT